MQYRQLIILVLIAVFAMLSLNSCSSVMMVKKNPTPSLKGLHIWDEHRGYTKEQFKNHPDYDCSR